MDLNLRLFTYFFRPPSQMRNRNVEITNEPVCKIDTWWRDEMRRDSYGGWRESYVGLERVGEFRREMNNEKVQNAGPYLPQFVSALLFTPSKISLAANECTYKEIKAEIRHEKKKMLHWSRRPAIPSPIPSPEGPLLCRSSHRASDDGVRCAYNVFSPPSKRHMCSSATNLRFWAVRRIAHPPTACWQTRREGVLSRSTPAKTYIFSALLFSSEGERKFSAKLRR